MAKMEGVLKSKETMQKPLVRKACSGLMFQKKLRSNGMMVLLQATEHHERKHKFQRNEMLSYCWTTTSSTLARKSECKQ